MKIFKVFPILLCLLFCSLAANAQFSISKVSPNKIDTKASPLEDTIRKLSAINNNFFSESRAQAERRRIRHERNTVNFGTGLKLSLAAFNNWASGGDNTFAGNANMMFSHVYQRNKFGINYKFEARYGLSVIDTTTFKNEDNFFLDFGTTWDINKNWSYSASGQFRSQFTKGYKSRMENILVSDFMAPGVITVSAGITYRNKKVPFNFTISPIGGSMTMVLNDELSKRGMHGVKPGEKQVSTLGSSFLLNFETKTKKEWLHYITYFYTFSNFSSNTYATWNNTLRFKFTNFFSFDFYISTKYDKYAITPDKRLLQFNYTAGISLAYSFSNK